MTELKNIKLFFYNKVVEDCVSIKKVFTKIINNTPGTDPGVIFLHLKTDL